MADRAEKSRRAAFRRSQVDLDTRYTLWNQAALLRYQQRERAILELLARHAFSQLGDARILDVGCGDGGTLRDFLDYGAKPENLAGVDLLDARVSEARRLAPHVDFRVGDAAHLPFEDRSFDLALAFTVFSSITDRHARRAVAAEMLRVVRPGGGVLWYDFWTNPVNRDVQALGLAEVRALFGRRPAEARRVTLAPPLARVMASRSWLACELLTKVPLLRSHWLALIPIADSSA